MTPAWARWSRQALDDCSWGVPFPFQPSGALTPTRIQTADPSHSGSSSACVARSRMSVPPPRQRPTVKRRPFRRGASDSGPLVGLVRGGQEPALCQEKNWWPGVRRRWEDPWPGLEDPIHIKQIPPIPIVGSAPRKRGRRRLSIHLTRHISRSASTSAAHFRHPEPPPPSTRPVPAPDVP